MAWLGRITAFKNEMEKIARGKYPVIEDDAGKTVVTAASVTAGGAGGYKIADTIKKMMKKRGGRYKYMGAAAGVLGGAALSRKINKRK